jgi:hypothetical protein
MNRRGQVNDISIAFGIILFITVITTAIWLLNVDFLLPYNAENLPADAIIKGEQNFSSPTGFLSTLFQYVVIGITGVPWWIITFIVLPLDVALAFIIARNIWIGGGS